jgi:hypothetical protein
VEHLAVSVYRPPTDLPDRDAPPARQATALAPVETVMAGVTDPGFTYGSPATALVVGHGAFDVPAAHDRTSRALRNAVRPAPPRPDNCSGSRTPFPAPSTI